MTRIETQNIKESLFHLLGSSANEYSTYLTTLLFTNKKPKELKLSSQGTFSSHSCPFKLYKKAIKLHNQLIQAIIANSSQTIPPPTLSNSINGTLKSASKQEESKTFIKRTLLSLSREDRQRLRTLKVFYIYKFVNIIVKATNPTISILITYF